MQTDNTALLPIFPVTGVLVPHGGLTIVASEEPYLQLLRESIEKQRPFASIYFTEEGLADYGCVAYPREWAEEDGKLFCRILGGQRFQVHAFVSFQGDQQLVQQNGRQVAFQAEEPFHSPYTYANVTLLEDDSVVIREDIREKVKDALLAGIDNAEDVALVNDAFADGLGGMLSYWILDQVMPDDTPDANAFRLQALRKRSENKRLRMLLGYLQGLQEKEGEPPQPSID